ncbi:acyl-CoA dehydrogenase family protein [Streptomyces triticiradicis]|uniref:Acyl-CoA dehydrogenase n=1 Tax=Streptomyces triticiradicis TaxID=2651189 RepID=A0A7J5DHJ2_9ACTN|nr:acyl-CoA dehydrogenase family protein [Streptomyces triticiradicis]KAB1988105.1 acyl-CoA dehydrogenase [Streptomyces triticiradicis]
MRFLLDAEQRAFAASLDAMLAAADTPSAVRAWADGDHAPGRALWSRLAEAGVFALAVPEAYEGVGPLPVDLAVAFVELGRHAVPGPVVETVAAAALLGELSALGEPGPAERLLPGLASGKSLATLVLPDDRTPAPNAPAPTDARTPDTAPPPPDRHTPDTTAAPSGGHTPDTTAAPSNRHMPDTAAPSGGHAPDTTAAPSGGHAPGPAPAVLSGGHALDADAAAVSLVVDGDRLRLASGHGPVRASVDRARRLARPESGGELLAAGPQVARAALRALAWARLATAAQALGVGLALLGRTVTYVGQRTQFGVPVASFQAVKHRLADATIALEFARPLLLGAALSMAPADVAAAKVRACEAAYATARTALQLHGAIGYTAEYDLSLWFTKARALRTAWGTPAECRAEALAGLSGGGRPRS